MVGGGFRWVVVVVGSSSIEQLNKYSFIEEIYKKKVVTNNSYVHL